MTLDISLDKRYLRVSAETFERYAVGAFPAEQFGRNWSGPAVADTNYEGLQAIENAEEYSTGTGDAPYGGGSGWASDPVTGTNA
jgi:hypothetical protein